MGERLPITPEFRTTITPVVDGADPYIENKYRSDFSTAINHRAQLIERIHLYEGPVKTVTLRDQTLQVQGYMDISQTFFTDGEITNQPFIGWGLRNAVTNWGIEGYHDSGISCDPIYAFRQTRIFEELPNLNADSKQHIDDFVSAATSAGRVWQKWQIEHYGAEELIRRRKKIAYQIGKSKLREIMQVLPPRLEEMMQAMYDKKRWVDTKSLERELRLKKLNPSEFYLDAIRSYGQFIGDIAAGLKETGGAL